MNAKVLYIAVALLFSLTSFVIADTLNVDFYDPGCNDTIGSPYCSIQAAIDDADPGDMINVSDGVYDEQLVVDKQLTLSGEGNPLTVIQPTNAPSLGVYDVEIDASNVIIQNFLFDFNGPGGDTRGGPDTGIVVCDLDEPPVTGVQILDNTIYTGDGDTSIETGKNCDVSGLLIQGNTFYGDESGMGEGIYVNPNSGIGTVTIDGNKFYGWLYSAVSIETNKVDVIGNIINSNSSQGTYGVRFIDLAGGEVYNNVFISNNNIQNLKYGIRVGTSTDVGSTLGASIESNTITNNDIGIWVRYGASLEDSIHYNSIRGNADWGVNNSGDSQVDATYNYWGDCNGPSGEGPGSGDKVTQNVTYAPWLGICIENKTNVSCAFETNNITVSADLSGTEINSVWVSYTVNGTNYNRTGQKGINNSYLFVIPSFDLIGGMNVMWNVYAADSAAVYNNSWKIFYVRAKTQLIVNPAIPDGLRGWYVTEPLFTLISDVLGGNKYYRWDSDGIRDGTLPFGLENIPNSPPLESAGILDLNWWTGFACGNESEQMELFYVDLTDPFVKNVQPANASFIYDTTPEISAYIDEIWQSNSGVNLSTVVMKVDGGLVAAGKSLADTLDATVIYTPETSLDEGIHNVSVYAEDYAGRQSEFTWWFEIGSPAAFNLTVYSPEDKVYESRRVGFNITTSKEVKSIEYINWNENIPRWKRLCRNCDEYGNSRARVKSPKEGQNVITIRATDHFDQVVEENISLIVETRLPKIMRTLPRRNSFVNGSGFYIKYSEENLQNISLFYGNKSDVSKALLTGCESGRNQECSIDVDVSSYDGQYIEYWFNVTDLLNTVQSRKTKVKVDTSTPIILTVNAPENDVNYTRLVPFNLTVSEEVKLEYYDKSVTRLLWRRLCSRCDEYGATRMRTRSFRERGEHEVLIRAIDKAGNSAIEEVKFNVEY